MKEFGRRLAERQGDPEGRRWLFVPYDQLSGQIGPLSREDPQELGIVVVESPWKASLRPYHRQKLALIVANLRHFALEQAGRGVAVRHVVARGPYREALRPLAEELGPLRLMEPAERELRVDLAPLVEAGEVEVVPHEGWLTTPEQFEASQKGPPWRMDAFYRHVRQATGLLMEGGRPVGGKYSFDSENREPWRGEPPAPEPPRFAADAIKEEVAELIEGEFGQHPGQVAMEALPATVAEAEALWAWAKEHCLPHFGPYEDAMSKSSWGIFHTRISPLLHLHRLLPRRVVQETAAMQAPLQSREGFVRQVLGWREFMRHVHRQTDGLRYLPAGASTVAERPGDGGYERWRGRAWSGSSPVPQQDGGASPSALGGSTPLPPAFWGKASGLHCLDHVVQGVWAEGWGHHITRLMVLANLATLLDVSPRQLTDWFWVAYTDAYDWVVEPNVLGMGTFAVGELMTTKPYISGAAYISRMGDLCGDCAFDPRHNCPITRLYWAFLARHARALEDNPRMRLPLASLGRRGDAECRRDREIFRWCRDRLARGHRVDPTRQEALPDA